MVVEDRLTLVDHCNTLKTLTLINRCNTQTRSATHRLIDELDTELFRNNSRYLHKLRNKGALVYMADGYKNVKQLTSLQNVWKGPSNGLWSVSLSPVSLLCLCLVSLSCVSLLCLSLVSLSCVSATLPV